MVGSLDRDLEDYPSVEKTYDYKSYESGIVAYKSSCKLGILTLIINVEGHLGTLHVQEVGR